MRQVVGITAVTAVALAPNLLRSIVAYDGGLAASAGTFISHGQIPYRDFWWLYGPLAGVVVAISNLLTSPSILVIRGLGLAVTALSAGVGYRILSARDERPLAAFVSVAAFIGPAFVLGVDLTAWAIAVLIGLIAIALVASERSVATGVLIGLTFLARLDIGGYLLLAILAAAPSRRVVLGFLSIAVPFGLFVLATTPIADAIQQLLWYPLVGVRVYRALPVPPTEDLFDAIVLAGILLGPKLAAAVAAARLLTHRSGRPRAWVALVVFAVLVQLQTVGRADLAHQATAAPLGLLTLAMAWMPSRVDDPLASRGQRAANLVSFGFALSVASLAFVFGLLDVARADIGRVSPYESNLVAAVRTVRANTSDGERIFVGLGTNRYTMLNPTIVYYLAGRPAASWGTMYNPGITNTDTTQARMVAEMEANGTAVLVLDTSAAEAFESTNQSAIPGSTILDTWIASRFRPACTFGSFRILARNERPGDISCLPAVDQTMLDVVLGREP